MRGDRFHTERFEIGVLEGRSYTLDTVNQAGCRAVEAAGRKIVIIPFVPGKSTTALRQKKRGSD